jgi:DNA-binding HxlR family transcriptional regulator
MNMTGLVELAAFFRHRWDPFILVLLAERPRRYRELANEVRDWSGAVISDGVLSAALARLAEEGLLLKLHSGPGHALYAATGRGRQKVERLRRLCDVAAQPPSG